MNAKKIMGAVLVALLAAALFVGAGAAVATNYGTAFESQNVTGVPTGEWFNGANVVVISADGIVGPVAVAGTYTKGEDSIYFTKPTASYSAIGLIGNVNYTVANGGNVYKGGYLNITAAALNTSVLVNNILVTYPNGSVLNETANVFTNKQMNDVGTYKIQAIFNNAEFVNGVDNALLLDTLKSFTFTVIDEADATISASTDAVYAGEAVKLTITGVPGTVYILNTSEFDIPLNQYVVLNQNATYGYNFTMPNNGVAEFAAVIKSTADDTAKIVLMYEKGAAVEAVDDGEIEITVSKPLINVSLDATSYFIGNDIELSGSTSFEVKSNTFTFNITGVNFKSTNLPTSSNDWKETGKNWKVVLSTFGVTEVGTGKALDVGTYTIEIIQGTNAKGEPNIVKTVTVALKQPFISILDAPEVVVQGEEAEFIINAEATQVKGIQAYIFGTNYFDFFAMGDGIKKDAKINNKFTVTIAEEDTDNMSAGQYFMVFQHPMYDEEFNVTAQTQNIVEWKDGNWVKLFNVYDRQTANAAQALCDALDSQNFDDMYVKYSFFIVAEGDAQYTISEIPTEVTQGTTITISGVDTANANEEVAVQMLSTAFAAVPKETAGSAAFVLVTTTVAEDGTWEVTLDTSNLNVDEYALTVKIADDLKKSVTVNVVEGADTPDTPDTPDVPDTPDTPDTPTEPTTPGFGALAALAGLGAVAVLLLRRE